MKSYLYHITQKSSCIASIWLNLSTKKKNLIFLCIRFRPFRVVVVGFLLFPIQYRNFLLFLLRKVFTFCVLIDVGSCSCVECVCCIIRSHQTFFFVIFVTFYPFWGFFSWLSCNIFISGG